MSTTPETTADTAPSGDDGVDSIEIRAVLPAAALPSLEPVLWLLSPNGILVEDAGSLGAGALPPGKARVGLYVAPGEVEATLAGLQSEADRLGVAIDLEQRPLARQDWNRLWKEHYHPFTVGRRIRIEPAWEQGPDRDGFVRIAIDPGLAFGTGTHETTRLALEAVEAELDRRLGPGADSSGLRVLDVGTGSGILAILAARMGATEVVGTEMDPSALPNAQANLTLNDVADRVRLVLTGDPGLLAPDRFDVVIANIISSVLLPLRDALADRLAAGGTLVLSGVLTREADEVLAAYAEAGLEVVGQAHDGGWAALTLRARPAANAA